MPFRFRQDNGYLLRVFYYRKRISAEFFHALTDGNGGMTFLKTLTVAYLRLMGKRVAYDCGALDVWFTPMTMKTAAFPRNSLSELRP